MEQNKLVSCLGRLYDILSQSISLLDVITDIIVCIGFWQNERMIFFGISIAILILALIAYDIAFIYQFSDEMKAYRKFYLFLSLLPISPFIPFIFYYSDKRDSIIPKLLKKHCCFKLLFYSMSVPKNASKFKQFFESKIERHFGFLLESLVEAFPQAILQMTAIVIYKEANIISIVSILISMLSVASKSFVFSMGTASNLKQLFFNWLCAVTDFFGIFFVVSWVFYMPQNEDLQDAFIMIRQVFLYKLYIFEFPTIGIPSIVLYLLFMYTISTDQTGSIYKRIFGSMLVLIASTLMWICGLIASILAIEITNWTWIAMTFMVVGTERFPTYNKLSLQFWYTLIRWINSAEKHHVGSRYKGCTSFTKKQDKIMRLSSVNFMLSTDSFLKAYLEKNQKENQYMAVTLKEIRMNTQNRHNAHLDMRFWEWYGEFWREAKHELSNAKSGYHGSGTCHKLNKYCIQTFYAFLVGMVTFLCAPIYFISRFVTLFFPAFIILYLYFGYNVNIWNCKDIDIFQIVMITIYIISSCILSILFYGNAKEQYLMAHLLPSKDYIGRGIGNLTEQEFDKKIKKITNHYYGNTVIPIRRAMVIDRFGSDLGQIILSYLPTHDHFEGIGDVLRVKTVV